MQDLNDMIHIKNTRLSDKNGVKMVISYILSKQNLCKNMFFNNF